MLSVAIITLNEEKNIKKCIESVKDISDDIVVVDSFSSDRTCEIAEKLGAKLVKRAFDDFSSQKNFAVSNCKYDWILSLDADEIVSDELKDEIKKLDLKNTEFSGFLIKRKNIYLGTPVKVWYPDWKLRLFKKSKGTWVGKIHEKIKVDGKVGKLKGEIIHFTYNSILEHLEKTIKFGREYAKISYSSYYRKPNRKWMRLTIKTMLIISPFWAFFKNYILKGGFKDGTRGLIISYSALIDRIARYSLLWEALEKKEESENDETNFDLNKF